MKHVKTLPGLSRVAITTLGLAILTTTGAWAEPSSPTTAPTSQPATQPTALKATDTEGLQAALKTYAAVSGEVYRASLSSSGKVFRIEFKGAQTSGFTAVIFPSNFRAFEEKFGADLPAALAGKKIVVEGNIAEYRGKPQIVLSSPAQLKIE